MSRNMTFSVSLKLLTKNFQNGIKSIQNSLGKLRQQMSTFVGGIGIGLGIKELIENAKQLDKAQTTLRNVSNGIESYGENLKFVQGLSKRYNQDLIVLMGNFAKFHSAAANENMALETQQHIYEALTRASAYFNLTADETNGVMLAVQQMISKGRVSSEELRRQLGERLPGALNLAAKAAGKVGITANGTTAELEEMIKEGKVLASELLPALASELNAITASLDVNTIQGYSNRLKNTFTEIVETLNVKDMFKDFLGSATETLDGLSEKVSAASVSIRKMVGWISNTFFFLAKNITTILGTIGFKKLLQAATTSWTNFFKGINTKLTESQTRLKIYKKELETLNKTNGVVYTTNTKTGKIGVNPKNNVGVDPKALNDAQIAAKAYNSELRRSNNLQGQMNNKWSTMRASIWKSVQNLWNFIGMQLLFTAISAALTLIISKTIQWFRKLTEVKRKVKEIKDDLNTDLNTVSPDQSKTESLFLKGNEDLEKRKNLIKEINKHLGRTGDLAFTEKNTDEEINAALQERLDLLKKSNELESKNKALAELKSEWNKQAGENTTVEDLKREKAELQKKINADKPNPNMSPETYSYAMAAWSMSHRKDKARVSKIDQLLDLSEQIDKLEKEVTDLQADPRLQKDGSGGIVDPGDGIDTETLEKQYKKIKDEHNNKLRALNERLADNVISQDDYDKAVKDLYFSTLESIYGLNNINEETDPFAKAIKDAVKVYLSQPDSIMETEKALKEYKKKVQEAKNQYANGVITQKELDEKLFDLLEEVVTATGSFSALSGAAEELANQYKAERRKKAREKLGEIETPKLGEYDSTFNYKKSNSEIYEDNADFIKDYTEQLEEFIDELRENRGNFTGVDLEMLDKHIENLEEGLITLTAKAESFSEAAKFAEVQEDIKKLKGELAEGIFDNVSNIATAAERLTNSWKTLTETMDDPDASGWEKFITIFTTIMSVIETVVGIVKAFQAVMAVAEALSLATAAAEQAGIPVKVQDAIATQAQAAAAKQLAIARHMSAAASVPYPANIAAIATTAGALAAAFAALPAFAEGGIVRGASSVGDRNLVRVNAGEAILTKMQQANLWHLLNGQGALLGKGVGGNVEFKIRGADLVGTINNYSKKISK